MGSRPPPRYADFAECPTEACGQVCLLFVCGAARLTCGVRECSPTLNDYRREGGFEAVSHREGSSRRVWPAGRRRVARAEWGEHRGWCGVDFGLGVCGFWGG